MASLSRRNTGQRPRPVMNVTPLVDVVLVLLIIFMVVLPAITQGVPIEIPGVFNADNAKSNDVDPFILSITKQGRIHLDDQALTEHALTDGQLTAALRVASHNEPHRKLVIRADESVPYAHVRGVYKTVQQVHFPGVSLRVNKRTATATQEP